MYWSKYRKSLTFLLVLWMGVMGCKKYEEGPAIALCTVKQRLTGEWEMKRLLVDEIDETAALLAHPANCIYSIVYNGECKVCFDVKIQCQNETKDRDLYLENNKEGLSISGGNQFFPAYGPIGIDTVFVIWKFQKLTNKEMKLKTSYIDGKEYELTFSKK